MMELLAQADPADGVEIDKAALRAKIDARIEGTAPAGLVSRRPLVGALATLMTAAVVLILVQPSAPVDALPVMTPPFESLGDLPGIETVVTLELGGVKTMVADGDTIWVMEALQRRLDRVDARQGTVIASYMIDAYVEGVVVGGDRVWLLSYDNGGEVLRFDPGLGRVDERIPLGGEPLHGAEWFADALWVGTDNGETLEIAPSGEVVGTVTGELKGLGFDRLWLNDPDTGLISSMSATGTRGEFEIPTVTGGDTSDGWGVRGVEEGGRYLFLMDDFYPYGTNLSVFDPETGEFRSFGGYTFGLLDMVWFDGSLWMTSHTDHVLLKVDPVSGESTRYPMPGKAGGLVVADGALWVSLYHPGAMVRVDPAWLIEAGPILADDWNLYPHRLLCTGPQDHTGPTVILEPYDWIDYGSWSVVQSQLNQAGLLVCANGYVEGEATPEERSTALEAALTAYGISGPYVLVGSGDGVHPLRLFAEGHDDIAGVVLVDPMPPGFPSFLDAVLGEGGHPEWADLPPAVSDALGGLGDVPLTVIGQDPRAVFLSERAMDGFGAARAEEINAYWQDGLDFYARLSTDTTSLVSEGTGMHTVLWDHANLITDAVLESIARG